MERPRNHRTLGVPYSRASRGRRHDPGQSLFVVVGGTEEPPYEMGPMASELARDLAEGGPVLAAETSDSQAEILVSIIDDGGDAPITTAEGVDTIIGRVAAVLALDSLHPRDSSVTTASGRPLTTLAVPFPG